LSMIGLKQYGVRSPIYELQWMFFYIIINQYAASRSIKSNRSYEKSHE
jgi:hypothetical protein